MARPSDLATAVAVIDLLSLMSLRLYEMKTWLLVGPHRALSGIRRPIHYPAHWAWFAPLEKGAT